MKIDVTETELKFIKKALNRTCLSLMQKGTDETNIQLCGYNWSTMIVKQANEMQDLVNKLTAQEKLEKK